MNNSKSVFFDRATLLHLRLPFSFFLLPIFIFGLSQAININWNNTILMFIVLHFFIYPASNIYNSYMDNDKGSIGGLKNPPPATVKLYYASIIFDSIGLLLCLLINWQMLLLMLIYVAVSKAYSWKKIRLKKYPYLGWLVVILFQGGYTFFLVNSAAEDCFNWSWFNIKNIEAMLLASLLIGGFYPLTQIYQHEEDIDRGDVTISAQLGISGTFIFSAVLFLASSLFAYLYFNKYYSFVFFEVFILSMLPVTGYFIFWYSETLKNIKMADYGHTMKMTFISSCCSIICYCLLFFLQHSNLIK